jgi:membrane protein required for colicin V production
MDGFFHGQLDLYVSHTAMPRSTRLGSPATRPPPTLPAQSSSLPQPAGLRIPPQTALPASPDRLQDPRRRGAWLGSLGVKPQSAIGEDTLTEIDGYDLVMVGILAAAAVLGYFKGIVWQLAWIAGIAVSSVVAIRFGSEAAPYFGEHEPWNRLLAMLALYAGTSVCVWLLFRVVSKAIDAIHLSSFDHQLGLLFGAAKGVLLCLVITFFAVTLAPAYRDQIVASRSGHLVADLLATAEDYLPPDIHATVAPYLDRFEQELNATANGQRPLTTDASTTESPLTSVWQGVQSVAAWAGVEAVAAQPALVTEQGGQQATLAGGPLPEGSSWFAPPSQPTSTALPPSSLPPSSLPPNTVPLTPVPPTQPATAAPGGYRVGTQSPLPQRW